MRPSQTATCSLKEIKQGNEKWAILGRVAREGLSEQVALEWRPEGGGEASPFPIRGGAVAAGASGLQARLVHPSKVLPGKLARCACLRKAQRLTEGGRVWGP